MAVDTPLMSLIGALLVLQTGNIAYESVRIVHTLKEEQMISGYGEVLNPVKPGETVFVDWYINKDTSCPGYSSRVWTGGDHFYMVEPRTSTSLPESPILEHYSIPTKVPETAPEGTLNLEIKGEYDCGDMFGKSTFTLGPVIMVVENGT